ncbi:hypothetical protein C3V36_13000 [Lachnospiraceae bacterium oral taxon 500]|nr:hypothetical protein C3V36_13000 [Lachnospiraceae bacterium oral taxon 500]
MLSKWLTRLLSLLSQDEYQTIHVLSQKLNLSTKTLRGLLRELNEQLEMHGAKISLERGKGYLLLVKDINQFQTLFLEPAKNTFEDADSRVRFLIEYFLKDERYTKADVLCEKLYISRKTLTLDLKQAEDVFQRFNLVLERKPHYGIRLMGDEFRKRQCLSYCRQQQSQGALGAAQDKKSQEYRVAQALVELLEQENYHITDVGLNSLVTHIAVAIQRIRAGQYIQLPPAENEKWSAGENYVLARKCAQCITQLTNVPYPESEIRYLAIHLASKQTNKNFVIGSDIQETVIEMLEEIDQIFQIDFRDDLELILFLSTHLVPLTIRIKYGMKLKNPLLKEIQHRYSLAYIIAVQASAVLERRYGCVLDSDEIAYLALPIQLSLERKRSDVKKKNILLVCASGAGTARLMAYKIQEQFGNWIDKITVCDQRNIKRQDFSKIDYVFTTVPIQEHVPVPICEVRQFLDGKRNGVIRGFLKGNLEEVLRYYPEQLFFSELSAATKEEALSKLVQRIGQFYSLPQDFYEAILKREKMAHTCMGNRVAMPHPYQVMTDDTFVSVAILKEPIQWDEAREVQAIFLVSVSRQKNKQLQEFYSTTARLLLDEQRISRLIQKRTYQALVECLETVEKERME